MKYYLISLLLICGRLSAENLDFLRANYLVEYVHHSRERASLFFVDEILQGRYHYRTPKGNLLYSGNLSKNGAFTQRDMAHKVSFASSKEKNSYAFTLGYGLEKENKNEYKYERYSIINKKQNSLFSDFSYRRSLSEKRALLLSLQSSSVFLQGEQLYFVRWGEKYTNWDLHYYTYNTPNISQSIGTNIGVTTYLQSKKGSPFVWLTDISWDVELQRFGDQVSLPLLESYGNDPSISKIIFTKHSTTYHTWRVRSSFLRVKEEARYMYPLKSAVTEKFCNINLHEATLQLSQLRRDNNYEKIVYATHASDHFKSEKRAHITDLELIANVDVTLFSYFFIGATTCTGVYWQQHSSYPPSTFYFGTTPEVGFRTTVSNNLFLTVSKEIESLTINNRSWAPIPWNYIGLKDFPLTISLSYTF